jgi:hypothetical protein
MAAGLAARGYLLMEERLMPYATYAETFVDSDGNPKPSIEVPESCIDSAEYIIRTIATNGARQSRSKVGPDMLAEFDNMDFNASKDDILAIKKRANSYNFAGLPDGLPDVGQGIILLNRTNGDLEYNMHLGAIVAKSPGKAVISHMFQTVRSYAQKPLEVLEITSAADFADKTFGRNANLYAAGLLKT